MVDLLSLLPKPFLTFGIGVEVVVGGLSLSHGGGGLSLKTYEELEKLAETLSNIQEGDDFGRRFLELCGDLTREEDMLALAEVHRGRAEEARRI